MAHFARLDEENTVTEVIVVANAAIGNVEFPESEFIGIQFCRSLYGEHTNWAQTSYNASFRHNYAGIGYKFDKTASSSGAFIPPQPYPSWDLNTTTYNWEAPVPRPNDGSVYRWDEETKSWVLVEQSHPLQ